MYCHKFEPIRDEVFCQIMKQTTNNKSATQVSWLNVVNFIYNETSYESGHLYTPVVLNRVPKKALGKSPNSEFDVYVLTCKL